MSGQRSNDTFSTRGVTTRRRRVVGLGASAGAFVAFGLSALSTSGTAYADDFGFGDWIADLFGHVDEASLGTGDVVGDGGTLTVSAALATMDTVNPAADMTTATTDSWLQQAVYVPIHTAVEDWINSPLGLQVGGFINDISGQFLIGDGLDGTATHPDGGAGGLWFGDGGDGYDQSGNAGVAGGAGGDAGWFGNGGDGGAGGAGAAGGDGGDGGQLFGVGGDGGNAGDGGDGLPALGGAGGNAGMLGQHGAVGHYGTLAGGPPSDAPSPLDTTGNWITDDDGRVVLLHGLNEVYKVAPYAPSAEGFSDDDAAFLADNGFNVVRLGVIWAGVEPEPGVYDDDYLASIEQTVQTLHEHGIVAILDFHQDAYSSAFGGDGAPEWAVQTGGQPNPDLAFPLNIFFNPAEQHAWDAFWSNADAPHGVGLENSYALMLEHVANYFNGTPGVGGFEIMNEPSPGASTFLSTIFGSSFFDSQQLTPFYDQAASAIRAVNPNTPVFFEPNVLGNAGLPTHLGTVDAENTVYSFHSYCQFQLGPLGCLPDVAGIVSSSQDYATSHGIPAMMTEFGASTDQMAVTAPMQAADQHLIGWTQWAYTEGLVSDPSQPLTGDNVNAAQLAMLAQPYPQVVAGTPESYSFDNGTFQFSYSTERVDGTGDFAAGSQTEIALPKVQFPDGYQVNVVGGHVISDDNAPELVIASDAGATTVNVTVTASPAT